MNLVHVVPHVDQEASGPSYSVVRLCESLATRGHDVELACLAAGAQVHGVRLNIYYQLPILRRFGVSPSHAIAMHRRSQVVDIVHNHSLWSMVNVASGLIVPGSRAKLVTSPRGTLSRWALGRRHRIKRALWSLQSRALTHAALLHATSEEEYRDIRAIGLSAPVVVIPNGIDLPALSMQKGGGTSRTLLFLGRIHPVKGIERLLFAWQQLAARHPTWSLAIVGEGEAPHERAVRELAIRLNLGRVHFHGALYGPQKSAAYSSADLFVLPTHSENFGIAVAEALAHGCPVIVTKGAPWSGLQTHRCGWWVEQDISSIVEALHAAMSLSQKELAVMGCRGRAWMEADFGWPSVADRMACAYSWATKGGAVPPFIRCD